MSFVHWFLLDTSPFVSHRCLHSSHIQRGTLDSSPETCCSLSLPHPCKWPDNLGGRLDSFLSLICYIQSILKPGGFYQNLFLIHPCLSVFTTTTLISCLEYCNSLLKIEVLPLVLPLTADSLWPSQKACSKMWATSSCLPTKLWLTYEQRGLPSANCIFYPVLLPSLSSYHNGCLLVARTH